MPAKLAHDLVVTHGAHASQKLVDLVVFAVRAGDDHEITRLERVRGELEKLKSNARAAATSTR